MNLYESLEFNYNRGDIVTSLNPQSPLYKRDCVVVDCNLTLVAVITEGINKVMFVPYDNLSLKLVKRGERALNAESKKMLKHIMDNWGYGKYIKGLPEAVEGARKQLKVDVTNRIWVRVDGNIPLSLATKWKELQSLIDLAKSTDSEIPNFIQTTLFEWMISTILLSLNMMQAQDDAKGVEA